MPDTNNSSQPQSFRDSIWPLWARQQEWRQDVEEQATRKALDIPDNDMNINVDRSVKTANSGVSPLLTAGLVAGSALLGGGIPTALMLGSGLLNQAAKTEAVSDTKSTDTKVESTVKTEGYKIEFYEERDGKLYPTNVDRAPK